MAINFFDNIKLNLSQLIEALLEKLSSEPTATEGRIYYNTTTKLIGYHNGTAWVYLDSTGVASTLADHIASGVSNGNLVHGSNTTPTAGKIAAYDGSARLSSGAAPTAASTQVLRALDIVTSITGSGSATKVVAESLLKSVIDTLSAVATQSANGMMSYTDKTKLNGIETSANNYVHPTTTGNKHLPSGGSANKFLKWLSDGTAQWADVEAGALVTYNLYANLSAAETALANYTFAAGEIAIFAYTIVAGVTGALVAFGTQAGTGTDSYQLVTTIDDIDAAITAHETDMGGHPTASTSVNGFMSATDKTKLDGVATNANNYSHPATHSADIIVDGTTNKAYTATEKTKLSGIADNANNYVHPTDAGNKHIPTAGSSNQLLKYSSSGTASWASFDDTLHGTRGGGTQHSAATTSVAGFMSSTDKSKLDGVDAGATKNPVVVVADATAWGNSAKTAGTFYIW